MPRKFQIAIVANTSSLSNLWEALSEIEAEYGPVFKLLLFRVHEINEELVDKEQVTTLLKESDVILCDIRGGDKALEAVKEAWQSSAATVIPLMGGSPEVMALTRMGSFSMKRLAQRGTRVELDYRRIKQLTNIVEKLGTFLPFGALRHAKNWVRAIKYWTNSGKDNLKNLLLFVAKEYGGLKVRPLPPQEFPEDGIYYPGINQRFRRLGDYLKVRPLDKDKPTIGIIYYGGMHFAP